MDGPEILTRLKAANVPQERIAAALGRSRTVATKLLAGDRSLKANEIPPLLKLLEEHATGEAQADSSDYVAVEIMPTYAGAGGGGVGEGDPGTVLVRRDLLVHRLRGRPSDFVFVEVRGDSMFPDFEDGDQLLCDKRDRNPVQPGPFALWDGDGIVIKNVERVTEGLRVFSTNPKYRERVIASDDEPVAILGRPVWFARSLR